MSFESIEWSDDILVLVEDLEDKVEDGGKLTRPERAVLDVVETVQLLDPEGDGLHEFWQTPIDHQRIIKSFDLIGAGAVVDAITAAQWCETRNADRDQYSETEAEYLAGIENELYEAMTELPDLLADFIEDEIGG